MGKIAIKIVSDGANVAAGVCSAAMMRPFGADLQRVGIEVAAANVAGGVLPMTQADYDTAVGGFFNAPDFVAPLTTSIVPALGVGPATFTRASVGYNVDWEGLLKSCVSGEARFYGARRVQNLITPTSAILTVGNNVTLTLAAGVYVFSMGAGTGTATFSGTGGATGTLVADAVSRTTITKTISAGTLIVTASVANLTFLQWEYVSGQSNQNPSEYTDAATNYGAGVTGVQYFSYQNGQTVV